MSIKRRGRRPTLKVMFKEVGNAPEMSAESISAIILQFVWHMAESQNFCPICLMNMAMDMMVEAETKGAIQHADDSREMGTETLQ